jgi:transmembrane sensor
MSASPAARSKPSAAARAEAAAWIARLHGPNRAPEVEAGLRRWMAEDPEHAAAFELVTDTWEKSARLRRRALEQVSGWVLPGFRISFLRAAASAAVIAVLAVIGTLLYLHNDAVTTAVGEQRTLTLEDGTRVYLNTDTRVVVRYAKEARQVKLEKGEALFEVAKRPKWPFIVTAGNQQIRALGTEFIVRRDERDLAVTLVEGKVTVSSDAAPALSSSALSSRDPAAKPTAAFTLSPGQRLVIAGSGTPTLDRPPLDRLTAWQRGQVSLDNTPLRDAVAEFNRYSKAHIVIQAPESAEIRVSGIFRAGDSEDFAQAVARAYGMRVVEQGEEIVLVQNAAPDSPPR